MKNNFLKNKMSLIPKLPGCYLWKNKDNKIIYVGKAKNLFNRTHQYFDKNVKYKINLLVNEIEDIDYIVVNNPNEALILENNLIKKYWPKFNTMLKDSSEYPYIVVTSDYEPKILYTRKFNKYKGKYYGPLADSKFNRYELFKFLNEISPIKREDILKENYGIFVNLYLKKYELDNIDNEKKLYEEWRKFIDDLFHGKSQSIINILKEMEEKSVERWDFDHAEKYNNLIQSIQELSTSQIVQLTKKKHIDYFCFYQNGDDISFNVFNYLDGKLISKHNSIHKIYDNIEDIVVSVINQYYSNNLLPKEVVVSLDQEQLNELTESLNVKFINPTNKTQKEIMNIGLKNAMNYFKNNKLAHERKLDLSINAANELAKLLNINNANHIEIFDNSNINLRHAVSAMVVFKNGVASKKDYRRYNLNEDNITSDYHYMQEVIYRRYSRFVNDLKSLPSLIIVDGGNIQVNAALISLRKLSLENKVNLIGLKKDNNHRTESIIKTDGSEIKLDKKSNLFLFLTNMQDEVHRFAIEFYRSKHLKSNFQTFLDTIEKIGPKTKKKIIDSYPTINDLKNASLKELSQIIPKVLAIEIKKKLD